MTMITEMAGAAVKTVAKAAVPTATAVIPKLAAETMTTGAQTLAKVAAPVTPIAEAVIKLPGRSFPSIARPELAERVFEAAKPAGEIGKILSPAVKQELLKALPAEMGLNMIARGVFTESEKPPLLSAAEMRAFANVADMPLPDDVLENPAFAKAFSESFYNQLVHANPGEFSLKDAFSRSLRQMLTNAKEANDLEKLKRAAISEAIREKLTSWRESIRGDTRLLDDERTKALQKVDRLEKKLNLAADIRMVFGKNFITDTVESFLGDPETA